MSMVGVTGLEPATSRPPAVRATSCATPRNFNTLRSQVLTWRLTTPRYAKVGARKT